MATKENTTQRRCGFCYNYEQGTNGAVMREWSRDFCMFISVCRKHTLETDPQKVIYETKT